MNFLPYRCLSSDCMLSGNSRFIRYYTIQEIKTAICPSCNRPANFRPLALIHLIQEDKALGVVYGSSQFGNEDRRYMFACAFSQRNFYQPLHSPLLPRHFGLTPDAATCYNCLVSFGAKLDDKTRILKLPS
jgi:hypothetical protein